MNPLNMSSPLKSSFCGNTHPLLTYLVTYLLVYLLTYLLDLLVIRMGYVEQMAQSA